MASIHDGGPSRGRTLDDILLRVKQGADEEQAEAKKRRHETRSTRLEANERRYEKRLESAGAEGKAIGEEQTVETDSTLIGWGIGTGGGTGFLVGGPLALLGGLIPAHKWRGMGEVAKRGFSEGARKAALDESHHGDLVGAEVDLAEAMEKTASNQVARARFAKDLAGSFESELRAGRNRAVDAENASLGTTRGTAAYAANLTSARASLEMVDDALREGRASRDDAHDRKIAQLQQAHAAERLRAHAGASRALKDGAKMFVSDIGLALAWCTYGISAAVAAIANGITDIAVEESLKGAERDAAQAEKSSAALRRTELLLEDQADGAEERLEEEMQRLDEIAAHQTSILKKMDA